MALRAGKGIEGATQADGRGESIWDRFAATPGKIRNCHTGEPACQSYTRYPEDIALMKAMHNWEIYPHGLYHMLTWLHQEYAGIPEIHVSENGISCPDVKNEDGRVHDPQRISFIRQHFDAALKAIEAGVPLKGYFVWSLMDNFEWAFGYDSRFGLAYVDFETQVRTIKDSGHWYGRVAQANALVDQGASHADA
jgi:beta-glucosidase/6-phospho-beta-glucosidase/beta-galactosidase